MAGAGSVSRRAGRGAAGARRSAIAIVPPIERTKSTVKVTVLDVADPATPAGRATSLDGRYDGSRVVDDRLYLVVNNDTWVPAARARAQPEPTPTPVPTPVPTPPQRPCLRRRPCRRPSRCCWTPGAASPSPA